jgi:hypothetical protein
MRMKSREPSWDHLFGLARRDALEEEWSRRRYERQMVELRKKCQKVFKTPPSVFVVERGFCCCPWCCSMIQDYGVPANIMTCPSCYRRWKIQAYFTLRKSGQPIRMTYSSMFRASSMARLPEGEPDELKPDEKVDFNYFCFERAVFQCPECGHLTFIKKEGYGTLSSVREVSAIGSCSLWFRVCPQPSHLAKIFQRMIRIPEISLSNRCRNQLPH